MPTEIYLVKAGMTMTEGVVEEWYIPDGGRVEKGQLLYRLETEKINLDVDAEASGIVKHLVEVGVAKEPGDVVGYIFAPGEEIPAQLAAPRERPDSVAPTARAPEPAPMASATDTTTPRERAAASPVARRRAEELGISLDGVRGTGPGGRITKEDVEAAAVGGVAAKAKPTLQPASAATTTAGATIPLRGMRKTIAQRMFDSLRSSAQLTMDMIVRMDDAVRLREQLIAEWKGEGIRPTYTDLVIRAAAKALRAHPRMNSRFGEKEIVLLGDVHVGMAVALDDGLVVPVIRHADKLEMKALAVETARLAEAARTNRLGLDDIAGGTFTVSALGMFGVESFTPILNAPETGILGVNRLYDGVEWEGQQPVKRAMLRLSLTWDHRVLDGAPAAAFLSAIKELLEAPYRLLV
jgi:pyruvate dehydrogenase E2 component (dihydrolipoamide acetyltransferase)